jgi:DNA-binding FrmR family transcriptional regulator
MGGKASDRAGAVHDRQHGAEAHREHGHSHRPHQQTKAVLNRLSRTEGHLRAVRRMVEEGRDCADILIQLAAIRSAVDRVARVVLEDHVESCLRQAATNGTPDDEWESLKTALDRFIS